MKNLKICPFCGGDAGIKSKNLKEFHMYGFNVIHVELPQILPYSKICLQD